MFRYRTLNIFGWSPYSSILTALAATTPDSPATPITSNFGTSVMIQWVAPYNGGAFINGYDIQILRSDGVTFSEELTYCNGMTDNTIISNQYCVIPMATL
jgi:hypothetical protein